MNTPSSPRPSRPELLAPAGDWDALRAAVVNGADAVYFGLANFNARFRAVNFTAEELPQIMQYLHDHGVRGYVTFNTLIFSDELAEMAELLALASEVGVDAVIVQDLGLARLAKQLAPGLSVHGSTQMTLTEPRGVEFVRRLGVERVILARELSVADVAKIAAQTVMPLEVFVHGALCVAYSGQCLTSEALGARSANRGQCAQACRMQYELVSDGKTVDLGDRAYLLSPQDLAAYDLIAPLAEAGVSSFKIEGRLKTAEYVAATVQTYRAAVDALSEDQPFELSRRGQLDLAQTFSRGLSHGFLDGVNHQVLVEGRFPKSRGILLGHVARIGWKGVVVDLADPDVPDVASPGDGVVFDLSRPQENEPGGRLWAVHAIHDDLPGRRVELIFERDSLDLTDIAPGLRVWKTDDPALRKRLQTSYSRDSAPRAAPVWCTVEGSVGGSLTVTFSDEQGRSASAVWPGPLQSPQKHAATVESLRDQLSRLGDTPYRLVDVELKADSPLMIPKSVLNDLRRQASTALREAQASADRRPPVDRSALDQLRAASAAPADSPTVSPAAAEAPRMSVLVRTMEQLEAVLEWMPPANMPRPARVYCDFEDPRRYRLAVEAARGFDMELAAATMRISKPGEEGFLAKLAESGVGAALVRNLTALEYFREKAPGLKLIGDFSLNVANELTAGLLKESGLDSLTPSYDLNWDQLASLLKRTDPSWWELVVHQHMPMFHMEHCVYAAFLSTGKDYRDCGRPCDRHQVDLRDRTGALFPMTADAGCRNTVFNAVPQSAAEYVPRMKTLGVRLLRVELLREARLDVPPLLNRYARVLSGLETGRTAWRGLQVLNQLGVTRGTLEGV